VLFTPASASCASGNIDTLFTVCRNCHSAPPNGAPVPLVTYAQIFGEKSTISDKLTGNLMPPPGSGYSINSTNKAAILAWISAGAVGVPYTNGICP
jgi:cytochrome c5